MNVWLHLPTIFNRRHALRSAGLVTLSVALITTLLFADFAQAAINTTKTINFQGRLLTKSGAVVADGQYNVQFKIYEGGSGSAAGNPDGTLKWTETYLNNGTSTGIQVKNGYFAASLGSITPFGTSINWENDTLWLSMNVAGSSASCTTFNTAPCAADGEMLPMKRITATPYSINSGAVGGKTANELVQLGQGAQNDSSTTSSIFINKTSTAGNLMQLQNSSNDAFTIDNKGNVVFGSSENKSVSVSTAAADTAGKTLTVVAGDGGSGTGANGGDLVLKGGGAGGTNANGGNITISGGSGSGSGASGLVVLSTPTFSTVTNDANCFTGGAAVASSCTLTSATLGNASAAMVGFTTNGQTVTLPDPATATAGRAFHIMASPASTDFTLLINGGQRIAMVKNDTKALIWNGTDWTTSSPDALTQVSVGGVDSIRLGDNTTSNGPSVLTLDGAASAPSSTDTALLGSMYYDTTLGKIQCFEADGWGACSSSPDTFITLSPEYSHAVMNGADVGTISSDICSDTLNLNDGSSGQPTICGTNETQNFYQWTTTEATNQTRSIYVTYQLPQNFKEFVANSTSLLGRTDSADAAVTYQIYRDSASSGLISCGGSPISVSTGVKTSWQKALATAGADPSTCGFQPGDSILIRINLTAKSSAKAYVSDLNFTFSNE